MMPINLIPAARQQVRAKKRRLAGWIIGAGAYCGAVAAIYASCYVAWASPIRPLDDELTKADASLTEMEHAISTAKAQVDELAQRLDSGKAVSHQPDWSALLALVSETLGPDIVLTKCDLKRIGGEIAPPPPAANTTPGAPKPVGPKVKPATAEPPTWTLAATGLGRSPASVSQFVLRLESTGLFDHVN